MNFLRLKPEVIFEGVVQQGSESFCRETRVSRKCPCVTEPSEFAYGEPTSLREGRLIAPLQ